MESEIKIGVKKYKCFNEKTVFELPKLVNLIIGKNNSGKSTFLRIIEKFYADKSSYYIRDNDSLIECCLGGNEIDVLVPRNPNDGFYATNLSIALEKIRKQLLGQKITYILNRSNLPTVALDQNSNETISKIIQDIRNLYHCIIEVKTQSLYKQIYASIGVGKYKIFEVSAERDIVPEKEEETINVDSKGQLFTNAVRYHYLDQNKNKSLLTDIRNDLNDILNGEDYFDELKITQLQDKKYEITLSSKGNDIYLSEMGSGIKTLLLALFFMHNCKNDPNSILVFEELENNIHPEIQRRLFNKIYAFAKEHNIKVFITSHSHVAINCFYGKDDSCIYHIFKDGGVSKILKIDNHLSRGQILDDLGVRAGDIFQTNGVIWVEGPSDRVYIKKWLNIVAPDLVENEHYSFLYYGGRLLSHYSADVNEQTISILLENRHSAIIMDSDKRNKSAEINKTKQRIKEEFENNNLFCWVTKGKEIENYISPEPLREKYCNENISKVGQYQIFQEYINDFETNFENKKVEFAQSLNFCKASLNMLDLKTQINKLAKTIRSWNTKIS